MVDLPQKQIVRRKGEIWAVFLLPAGWGAMLAAIAFYLLFWRVDNEPGAKDIPSLLWTAVILGISGNVTFVAAHIYLIKHRAWLMLGIAWVLGLVVLAGAVALAPMVLIMLV